MLCQDVDRAPFWIFWGPWATTWARWQREGMKLEYGQLAGYFGSDQTPSTVPVKVGPCPSLHQVLEENDQFVIYIDSWGIKRRNFKHSESMSEFIEFPVKNGDDWRKYKQQRLNPADPRRLERDWLSQCRHWIASGRPLRLGDFPDVGIFGTLRWLLGDEECLLAFYTQPDLVHDIMNHMTDLYLHVFQVVVEQVPIDQLHIWEDMSGRQGSLISPDHWREFMLPCYRRLADFAARHKIPLMSVDTDGNPDAIIPPMIEGGVNMLFPLEVQAGCDVNDIQRRYPQLSLMGGIDKRALARDSQAIDAELERIAPALRDGRYIPELDHLVPDDVSWDNYCHYARSLRALIGK